MQAEPNHASDDESADDPNRIRRGRKREPDDMYFIKGNQKIAQIKKVLKTQGTNMTTAQKQRLRNQISA